MTYIYISHPELRISDYPSGTGKGAGSLEVEHRGSSSEGAVSEHGGALREH